MVKLTRKGKPVQPTTTTTTTNNNPPSTPRKKQFTLTQSEYEDLYYCFTSARSKYSTTHNNYVEKTGKSFDESPEDFPPSVRAIWNSEKILKRIKRFVK